MMKAAARGVSQEGLANDAGVDRPYLSRVERAVTYVGLEIVGELAEVLEVDPIEFFRRPTRSGSRRKAELTALPGPACHSLCSAEFVSRAAMRAPGRRARHVRSTRDNGHTGEQANWTLSAKRISPLDWKIQPFNHLVRGRQIAPEEC
jgi:transcriptional regulator with XRE-family HTH domain